MNRYKIKARNKEDFGELLEFLNDCSVKPIYFSDDKHYVIVTSKQLTSDELGMLGDSFSVQQVFECED